MQNLLVILFPQLVDGVNALLGADTSRTKFWVSLITSIIGGILLNIDSLRVVLLQPDVTHITSYLTLLGLIVASTQGIYTKYWENHALRPKIFPTVIAKEIDAVAAPVEAVPATEDVIAQ